MSLLEMQKIVGISTVRGEGITGALVRIQRDGKWGAFDIAELTNDELVDFARSQEPDRGWSWALFLAAWIRENRIREIGGPDDDGA